MAQVTKEEADWAFLQVERFRDQVFEVEPSDLPTVEELGYSVACLILWYRLDSSVPKISKLMKLLDRNGVSYRSLADLIEPFYLHVFDLREREAETGKRTMDQAKLPETPDDDLF